MGMMDTPPDVNPRANLRWGRNNRSPEEERAIRRSRERAAEERALRAAENREDPTWRPASWGRIDD